MLPPFSSLSETSSSQKHVTSRSFFSKVQALFFSIAEKVISQTKKTESPPPSLIGRVEQRKLTLSSDEKAILKGEINELESMRRMLLEAEGDKSLCFSNRYIDPTLSRLKEIQSLVCAEKRTSGSNFVTEDVIRQIAALKRGCGKRLKKRVIESVQKFVYDDLAYIASYQDMVTLVEGSSRPEIEEIVSLLLDLIKSAPRKEGIYILYRWKQMVDLLRQELVNLAVIIIDKESEEMKDTIALEYEKEIDQIVSMLRSLLSNKSGSSEAKGNEPLGQSVTNISLRNNMAFFISKYLENH